MSSSIAKIIMHLSVYFGYSLLIDTRPSGAEECLKALYGFCSHQNTKNITVKEKFPCKKSKVVNNSSTKMPVNFEMLMSMRIGGVKEFNYDIIPVEMVTPEEVQKQKRLWEELRKKNERNPRPSFPAPTTPSYQKNPGKPIKPRYYEQGILGEGDYAL